MLFRSVAQHGVPVSAATLLVGDGRLADLFEAAVLQGARAGPTASWIINEIAPTGELVEARYLADVMKVLDSGQITREQAREVLRTGADPAKVISDRGYAQVSDASELEALVREVINANPKAAADYRAGKKQALGALMADLKKKAPHANAKIANELLQKLLS